MTEPFPFPLIIHFSLMLIAVALVIALIRTLLGPSLPDRIMGLDLTASLAIAFVIVYAIGSNESRYIDIAAIVMLVLFIATVAYSLHLKRRIDD